MNDDTQMMRHPNREEPIGGSHFLSISIRAWLAIVLVGTVCLHSIAGLVITVCISIKTGVINTEMLKVTEPLYTMGGMVLAFYFGQQKQKTTP